ncbi:CPBP family intramembrane metalloprotease [Candidatus Gottesmanbacteria bacterium]|nr:CPBP family intramembrane metalloprotease [Candidatus Gottesmanbacteria bacterium]
MKKHQVYLVWFVIFLLWAFYRANFNLAEGVDEFLIKPLIFVLPVIFAVRFRERRRLSSLGIPASPRDFFVDLYLGVVVGILFALEGLLANYLKYGKLSFGPVMALQISGGVVPFLFVNLATSIWEEILGRGYLYQRLYEISKNQFGSAFTSGFLFLLLHIPIMFTRLHLTGISLLVYPVSILLLGITNSYILRWRGSLTLPILIHTFWNMTVALYL